jgi:integrase
VQLLREHQAQQGKDRERARQLWRESGYVFTSPTGQPLNPNSDYHRWKALLKKAGVRTPGYTMPGTPRRSCS